MAIKRAILEALDVAQRAISAEFGKDSERMYYDLPPELKTALQGFPREVIACGARVLEDYAKKCGDTID